MTTSLTTARPAPAEAPLLVFGTGGSTASSFSEESRMVLVDYWRSISRHKWAILALALAAALVAAAVAFSLRPVFRSTATVLVEAGKPKIVSIEEVYSAPGQHREHFQTQAEILKSREVAHRTVLATKLWNHPEFDPRQRSEGMLDRVKSLLSMVRTDDRDWSDEEALAAATVPLFTRALDVDPVRLSQLIKVSFESHSPELASRVANATARAYIEGDRDSRFELTRKVNSDLLDRAEELRAKLDASEAALQKYRDAKGIVSLNGSAQAGAALQINEFTERLATARVRRTELESAYRQAQSAKQGDYRSVPAVVGNTFVGDAQSKVSEAKARLDELASRYGANHPKFIEAEIALRAAREHLQRQVDAVVTALSNEYQAARATEQSLAAALAAARGTVQEVNREEFQLAVLEREVATNKHLYEVFLSRAKETDVGSELHAPVARVVDSATPGRAPVHPRKAQLIVMGFALGLLAGAFGALLLDRLDTTLKGVDDAEQHLAHPVLTALPLVSDKEVVAKLPRLFLDEPHSQHSEAIRTARTGVLLSSLDLEHRVLLVTSSVPGEGKTTVSTNLALAHAQTKRTLLIDADMRRPQVGRRLGLPLLAKGLSNLVAGTATLEQCVHRIPGSSLLIMPAGDVPPNPLELLLSQRFQDAWKSLQEMADIVVVDSPPVELVSDAQALAPLASSVIYVVKAMQTPYPLARKGLTRLQRAGGNVLGVVLNQLDFQKAQQYYGEVSGQYGYGGYATYGAKPELNAPSLQAANAA